MERRTLIELSSSVYSKASRKLHNGWAYGPLRVPRLTPSREIARMTMGTSVGEHSRVVRYDASSGPHLTGHRRLRAVPNRDVNCRPTTDG
jgi:hypothetical protein